MKEEEVILGELICHKAVISTEYVSIYHVNYLSSLPIPNFAWPPFPKVSAAAKHGSNVPLDNGG